MMYISYSLFKLTSREQDYTNIGGPARLHDNIINICHKTIVEDKVKRQQEEKGKYSSDSGIMLYGCSQ